MNDNHSNIQSSLLDRLIDREPEVTRESVQQRLVTFRQVKESVVRDMESLLNTRRQIFPVPPEYTEVNNSVFVYGLPDFSSLDPRSPAIRQMLRRDIEQTISKFERRLKNIKVQIETSVQNDRKIRFRISALLIIEPFSEPVTFDTYLDINRSEYVVSK